MKGIILPDCAHSKAERITNVHCADVFMKQNCFIIARFIKESEVTANEISAPDGISVKCLKYS